VLRQRISYLSESTDRKSWLQLLSWDSSRAAKLPAAVQHIDLEPHPVSGELELDDVRPAKYQRLDEETLHARLEVEQFGLLPVYVWCESDEHGDTGPGWKLAELRALEDLEDGTEWYDSPSDANYTAAPDAGAPNSAPTPAEEEENDDYWAAYDRTPGQTPAPDVKPNPHPTNGRQMADAQYFARYANEVQPALDSHDPDESSGHIGESTLRGDSLLDQTSLGFTSPPPQLASFDHASYNHPQSNNHLNIPTADQDHLSMPRPISPTSSHSSVEHLEERAAAMSQEDTQKSSYNEGALQAQRGIKMHISTDIKSLFRLAKSSGMDRAEFEEIIRRELDVLSLLEQDE
jgi:hypothetical protein